MQDQCPAKWIAIGRVVGAFGVRGQLKVVPTGNSPKRFQRLKRLYLGQTQVHCEIEHHQLRGSEVLLKLKGIDTRESAVAQRYDYLYLPESEALELAPNEHFIHQIVGLQVHTEEGELLGSVEDVIKTGANDVYVVRGPQWEVLVPALKSVIRTINLGSGNLTVVLPRGLLDTTKRPSVGQSRKRRHRSPSTSAGEEEC